VIRLIQLYLVAGLPRRALLFILLIGSKEPSEYVRQYKLILEELTEALFRQVGGLGVNRLATAAAVTNSSITSLEPWIRSAGARDIMGGHIDCYMDCCKYQ
jgi:hypothetical protein